jgi:hypothetical protein
MPKGIYERKPTQGFQKGHQRLLKHHTEETKNHLSNIKRGDRNDNWKGGKHKNYAGYILTNPETPERGKTTLYYFEHRLVMEKHLGRKLRLDECIHHINGIKTDNRIENLKIMNNGEHVKLHRSGGIYERSRS